MTRPTTPDRTNPDGSKTITTKRACNGCGHLIGDITNQEMALAIAGASLPDVRRECVTCAPTAPEPVCRPARIVAGDVHCLHLDCDHDIALDAEYCVEVTEQAICVTHSETSDSGDIVRTEPWPCKHTDAITKGAPA
ncbi:hypothetical protein ACFXKI_09900 [Streptomyces mirabilis]|uniref:hypothetical protein n=1 Tax=Streptomyces mirabilis TaxID=68239 RepID=UPI0036B3D502